MSHFNDPRNNSIGHKRRVLLLLAAAFLVLMLPLLNTGHNTACFISLQHMSRHLPDFFWFFATEMGEPLILLSLLVLRMRLLPEDMKTILLALLIGTLIVHGLKHLLDVMRPAAVLGSDAIHIIGKTLRSHSFPSGHTATVFAIAAFIFLRNRTNWRYGALLGAAIVGLSRVAVGAHWPMDVLAGASAGIVATVSAQYIASKWAWRPSELACVCFSLFILVVTLLWGVQQLSSVTVLRHFIGLN